MKWTIRTDILTEKRRYKGNVKFLPKYNIVQLDREADDTIMDTVYYSASGNYEFFARMMCGGTGEILNFECYKIDSDNKAICFIDSEESITQKDILPYSVIAGIIEHHQYDVLPLIISFIEKCLSIDALKCSLP